MTRSRFFPTAVILLLILLPILTLAHLRYSSSIFRLPESGKEICPLSGLKEAVDIALDYRGIPHISAENREDLYFAQGFVEARDRFFQMDMARRRAQGKLAELLGEKAVERDRVARTLRFGALAREQAARLDEKESLALESFTAGINAALDEYGSWISTEVWATGIAPEPWTVEDSLAIFLRWGFEASPALSREIQRWNELSHYGPELASRLWGWTRKQQRSWIPAMDQTLAPAPLLDFMEKTYGREGWTGGANLWAVAGSRSATGRPILANDPHRGFESIREWYAIDLRAPGLHAAGLTLPGIPGLIMGHNESVAWGFSSSGVDDMDLFEIHLDDAGNSEVIDGKSIPLRTIREVLRIRWKDEPLSFKLQISRSGPVIHQQRDRGIVLRWSGAETGYSLSPYLALLESRTAKESASVWKDSPQPPMIMIAADTGGHLKEQWIGLRPRRRRGAGRLPSPGYSSRWCWNGFHSFASNIHLSDPSDAFLVAANADVFAEGTLPSSVSPIAGDYSSPWRSRRIRDRLRRRRDWSAESCLELQEDLVSLRLVALLKLLRPDLEELKDSRASCLLSWDGILKPGSIEASLYERLLFELGKAIGDDEASLAGMPKTAFHPDRILNLLAGGLSSEFWDDLLTTEVEDRETILNRVFEKLNTEGVQKPWGKVHGRRLHHPLGKFPLFGSFFSFMNHRSSLSYGGDDSTIFRTPLSRVRSPRLRGAPNARFVADVGAWDLSILILPMGESGRLWSAHATDQLNDWLDGHARFFPFSPQAVEASTRARIEAVPLKTEGREEPGKTGES